MNFKELFRVNKSYNYFNNTLIGFIADFRYLFMCYQHTKKKLKSKFNIFNHIVLLSKKLRKGRYEFRLASCRIKILSFSKFKRYCFINCLQDKIVKKVIYVTLKTIYDSGLQKSFFTNNFVTHSFLFNHNLRFYLKSDKCYLQIRVNKELHIVLLRSLLGILKKRISCSKFFLLIKSLIKCDLAANSFCVLNILYFNEFDFQAKHFLEFLIKDKVFKTLSNQRKNCGKINKVECSLSVSLTEVTKFTNKN